MGQFIWQQRIFLSILILFVGLAACGPGTQPESSPSPVAESGTPTTPGTAAVDTSAVTPDDPYAHQRQSMVDFQLKGRDISNPVVLEAMNQVPRQAFVPADWRNQSYADHPLPIGYGQTISQPYIVALMTELVDLQPGDRVLEIGTGSGYQAAVLAELTDQVYTIEIIPELAERASATFAAEGYSQIVAKQGDGYWGWEEHGPFEAILVTAAPDHVPQPLVNQLADGGKMVIPIGPPGGYQSLWILERQGEQILRTNWGGVRFVPFTRAE